ncbi:MAG: radical SAM protein, partial [Candidatus Bipolaricaulia bacterium]
SVEEVAAALKEALRRMEDLDVITFSGNGEPTLHPEFPKIVAAALELRDRLAPGKPVGILSSGAMVHLPEVRAALNRLDLQIMKLDAGDEQTFREINRPVAGLGLEGIVHGLQQLDRVILQTLLVKGPRENSSPEKIEKLIRRVRAIRPQEVQLYTLVRPPAEEDVAPVPREELLEIARRIRAETEMVIKVY